VSEELGKLRPGDEVWMGVDPFLVCMNRIRETASLQYSTNNGATVDVALGIDTALGLIRDLNMKLTEKGEAQNP
jgi:hypothetical protein